VKTSCEFGNERSGSIKCWSQSPPITPSNAPTANNVYLPFLGELDNHCGDLFSVRKNRDKY
jgi:hypothetical protein